MKKTYFMKTFNLNLNLLMLSILGLFFTILSGALAPKLGDLDTFAPLSENTFYFEKFHGLVFTVTLLLALTLIISAVIEINSRLANDSLTNYFKAVIETHRLRRFAVQNERTKNIGNGSQSNATVNPIYLDFNRAVRKSAVDITENQILVFIKVPHSQQAQKILKDMENLLKEEISSRNHDYVFSDPQRIKNQLWFTGTRR